MEKKGVIVLALGVLVLLFGIYMATPFLIEKVNFSPLSLVGYSISGLVDIYIDGTQRVVYLDNPQNITYYFDKGVPFLIPFNVSASFIVEEWEYTVYDLTHDVNQIGLPALENPNGTIDAYRWQNLIEVRAKEKDGEWYTNQTYFYVSVPNSAPIISEFPDNIFRCEGKSLGYKFNSTDVDEERGYPSMSPWDDIFYVDDRRMVGINTTIHEIFSIPLVKEYAGGINAGSKTYNKVITVSDNYNASCCADSVTKNITVIEINNAPDMTGIGLQTVWILGDDSEFNHQMQVRDIENGNSDAGNLDFTINFGPVDNLFEINSTGHMYYDPTIEDNNSLFTVTVCAEDSAITNPHPNISICAPDNYTAVQVCDDFNIFFTDENRPPQVVDYTPYTNVRGDTDIDFWAEVYDPDSSPYNLWPDMYWYVDGVLKDSTENKSNYTFTYRFPCQVFGEHNVTVVASDGALNDSYTWNLDVSLVACPIGDEDSSGGGGGGGIEGTTRKCDEEWVCVPWTTCMNVKRSFESKLLSPEEYFGYTGECDSLNYTDDRFCGFQLRTCRDVNFCNNTPYRVERPSEVGICYFTENPGCSDGIKNCHSGGCEILTDCGGPCPACPTCTDGIQNGGETGIDCGGPCPYLCEKENPLSTSGFIWVLLVILTIVVVFIGIRIMRIFKYRKELELKRRKGGRWKRN